MSEKNISKSFLTHPPVEKGDFNQFIKENLKDWITYANLKERIFNEYAITYPRRSWNKYIVNRIKKTLLNAITKKKMIQNLTLSIHK